MRAEANSRRTTLKTKSPEATSNSFTTLKIRPMFFSVSVSRITLAGL